MPRRTAPVALLVLALAACGGGGPKVDYGSPASMAQALHAGGFACTGYRDVPDAIGPERAGECTHGEDIVRLDVFSSGQARDQIIKSVGAMLGGDEDGYDGTSVVKDNWLVQPGTAAEAQQIQKILGGEVR